MDTTSILEYLRGIGWFKSCGTRGDGLFLFIDDVLSAAKSISSRRYDRVLSDALNSISGFHYDNGRQSEILNWNRSVSEIKVGFLNEFDFSPLRSFFSDRQFESVRTAVQWDILTIAMFKRYGADMQGSRLNDLCSVYEAGHIACGWSGTKFPVGEYIVF